jgi:hypothetical protein
MHVNAGTGAVTYDVTVKLENVIQPNLSLGMKLPRRGKPLMKEHIESSAIPAAMIAATLRNASGNKPNRTPAPTRKSAPHSEPIP